MYALGLRVFLYIFLSDVLDLCGLNHLSFREPDCRENCYERLDIYLVRGSYCTCFNAPDQIETWVSPLIKSYAYLYKTTSIPPTLSLKSHPNPSLSNPNSPQYNLPNRPPSNLPRNSNNHRLQIPTPKQDIKRLDITQQHQMRINNTQRQQRRQQIKQPSHILRRQVRPQRDLRCSEIRLQQCRRGCGVSR